MAALEQLRLQFLNGNNNKFVFFKGQKQLMTASCPFALAADPALLVVTANGTNVPCHFGGRQRLGVRTAGEKNGGPDSIKPGEELVFTPGSALAGRTWVAADLRIDAGNGATVTIAFYNGNTLVGTQEIQASGGGSNTQTYRVDAGGAAFDKMVLGSAGGSYGLKGFRDAVVFYLLNQ